MCRRVLTQAGLPAGHRTARGALWSTSWELWESFWIHSGDHFRPEFIPIPFRSFSRSQFALALALRLFFLVRKRCASMLKIDVELTEHTSCEAGRVSWDARISCWAVAHTFAHGLDIRSFPFATLSPATEKLRVHLFSRVGACGRRPLESADPGLRRVGAVGTESNAGLGLGKLYGGRGLRTKVAPTCPFWRPESAVF